MHAPMFLISLISITLVHILLTPPWKTALYKTFCAALLKRNHPIRYQFIIIQISPEDISRILDVSYPRLHQAGQAGPELRPAVTGHPSATDVTD